MSVSRPPLRKSPAGTPPAMKATSKARAETRKQEPREAHPTEAAGEKSRAAETTKLEPRSSGATAIFSALNTPARLREDYTQIGITIPKAHMAVLDSEASLFGLRRGQFLELLFLNAIGQSAIARMPASPKYVLNAKELSETARYLWYIRKNVKKLLDEYLLRIGIKPAAWIVLALNRWAELQPEEAE